MIDDVRTGMAFNAHVADWIVKLVEEGYSWDNETELGESFRERLIERLGKELFDKVSLDIDAMVTHTIACIPVVISVNKISEGYALSQRFRMEGVN